MKQVRLKKGVIYGIYSLIGISLIGTIYLIENATKPSLNTDDYKYVSLTIFDDDIPVVADSNIKKIIRPYNNEDVKIVKNYYDYQSDENSQQNSIMIYQNTYMQSSGVCYGKTDVFNVMSILDGKVIDIKEDELLGKTVQIQHENNIISIYQSLSDVSVKKDQDIKAGEIIGTSGTSNLNKDIGNHLYFELIINGSIVNPEQYYDKLVSEL
ncbi:MAG: M23 family metallopeptidase [Bacilli bacterium]|nr:M23 family metallopeptidase [Bacilli bacterium]